MAAGAGWVGRAKCGAYMASLAGNVNVRAIEYEPGTEMVKRLLRLGGPLQKKESEQHDHQYAQPVERAAGVILGLPSRKNHCNDLTSVKDWSLWQRPQSGPNSPS